MNTVTGNIERLKKTIPGHVTLVAVSKKRDAGEILAAYNAGQRIFGENRVQELLQKKKILPDDIQWHLIGHLQTNKVRQIVPAVSMIESVDTLRLMSLISDEAARNNRVLDILLQVHIASEETKSGFDYEEVVKTDWKTVAETMPGVRIRGLMGMATFTDDNALVRSEFRSLFGLFNSLKKSCFDGIDYFDHISMGMSDDWETAVEEGSTMIRLGTIIFGERTKQQHE